MYNRRYLHSQFPFLLVDIFYMKSSVIIKFNDRQDVFLNICNISLFQNLHKDMPFLSNETPLNSQT